MLHRTESVQQCLYTEFPLPILLYVGYSMKLNGKRTHNPAHALHHNSPQRSTNQSTNTTTSITPQTLQTKIINNNHTNDTNIMKITWHSKHIKYSRTQRLGHTNTNSKFIYLPCTSRCTNCSGTLTELKTITRPQRQISNLQSEIRRAYIRSCFKVFEAMLYMYCFFCFCINVSFFNCSVVARGHTRVCVWIRFALEEMKYLILLLYYLRPVMAQRHKVWL